MTISLDQINAVINVEIADLTFISSGVYTFDTDAFRQTLRQLEDDEANCIYPKTHDHVQPITVGGVALARVIEISPHWTVTFEDGLYRVTLLGSNNNVLDVATVNQVSIASTNSAGLTYSKQVEDQTFTDSRVWIDTDAGGAGIIFPLGTPGDPSSNLADSQTIISNRTLPARLQVRGVITLTGSDDIDGYDIKGTSAELASIALGGASTSGTHITDCTLSGAASGDMSLVDCDISTMTGFAGSMRGCGFESVTLAAGEVSNSYQFIRGHSLVEGTNKAVLDANSVTTPEIQFRGQIGGLELQNLTGGNVSIDGQGRLTLDSTCTGGTIVVGGHWQVTDNSGAGCTVVPASNSDRITWDYTGP